MKNKLLTKQIKNRYIIYIILFSYFLGSLLGIFIHDIVIATDNELIENYENQLTDVSDFQSISYSGTWAETISQSNSKGKFWKVATSFGNKTYYNGYQTIATDTNQWSEMELTDNASYINISAFIRSLADTSNSGINIYLNSTDGTNICFMRYTYQGTSPQYNWDIYCGSDHWNYKYDNNNYCVNFTFSARYISDNKTIYFMITYKDDRLGGHNWSHGLYFDDIPVDFIGDFKTIAFKSTQISGKPRDYYINDVTVSLNSFNYGDLTDFSYIGDSCGESKQYITNPCIEKLYRVPISCTVKGFDLYLGTDTNYILDEIVLYLNGENMGCPDYLINSGDCYVMRWLGFNKELRNEEFLIELKNPNKILSNFYWELSYTYGDTDGDGDGFIYVHNNLDLIGNGDLDGDFFKHTPSLDLNYRLYGDFSEFSEPIDPVDPVNDLLSFTGEGYLGINPDYDVKQFLQNTSVFITYNVITLANDNKMYVKYVPTDEYVGQTQGLSPIILLNYNGIISFVPYNYGLYNVIIIRDSIEVVNKSFYSVNNTEDYQVWTVPGITNLFQNYQVHYKYSNLEKNGKLAVFKGNTNTNKIENAYDSFFIEKNSSGRSLNFVPFSFDHDIDYWRLFVEVYNGTFEPIGSIHRHILINPSILSSVYVDTNPLVLGLDGSESQTICYTHNFLGSNVAIFLNNENIKDISFDSEGCFGYTISKLGIYKLYLKIEINGTWYSLANCTFTTISHIEDETGGGIDDKQMISWSAGIIITMIFFLIPLIFLKDKTDNPVAMGIIVFSGFFGLSLSILFGLLPSWIIAFVTVIVILMIVFVWLSRKIAT